MFWNEVVVVYYIRNSYHDQSETEEENLYMRMTYRSLTIIDLFSEEWWTKGTSIFCNKSFPRLVEFNAKECLIITRCDVSQHSQKLSFYSYSSYKLIYQTSVHPSLDTYRVHKGKAIFMRLIQADNTGFVFGAFHVCILTGRVLVMKQFPLKHRERIETLEYFDNTIFIQLSHQSSIVAYKTIKIKIEIQKYITYHLVVKESNSETELPSAMIRLCTQSAYQRLSFVQIGQQKSGKQMVAVFLQKYLVIVQYIIYINIKNIICCYFIPQGVILDHRTSIIITASRDQDYIFIYYALGGILRIFNLNNSQQVGAEHVLTNIGQIEQGVAPDFQFDDKRNLILLSATYGRILKFQ